MSRWNHPNSVATGFKTCKRCSEGFIARSKYHALCRYCGKEAKSTCSKCKIGKFCNRECQSKYWPIHKQVCDEIFEFIDITPLTVPMEKFIILND